MVTYSKSSLHLAAVTLWYGPLKLLLVDCYSIFSIRTSEVAIQLPVRGVTILEIDNLIQFLI